MKGLLAVIWLVALGTVVGVCAEHLWAQDSKDEGLGGLMDPVDPSSFLPAATPTPATGPATRPAPTTRPANPTSQPGGMTPIQQAFGRILDSHSAQLAAKLTKDDPDHEKAQLALMSLQGAFVEGLASQYDKASPEARMRIVDTLRQCAQDARARRMESTLSPALRAKLQEFRRLNSRLFLDSVSEDQSRREAAMRAIEKLDDPKRLCEPLILLTLQNWTPQCRVAAMDAALAKNCRSDEIIDAVTDILTDQNQSGMRMPYFRGRMEGPADPTGKALQLLQEWKPVRATPRLMGLFAQRLDNNDLMSPVLDLLIAINDPRTVPMARGMLDTASANSMNSIPDGRGKSISFAPSDRVLYLLLRQTGQSPEAYGMVTVGESESESDYQNSFAGVWGFAKPDARKPAIEKFKKWYTANKDRYKGVERVKPVRPTQSQGEPILAYKADSLAAPGDSVLDVSSLREEIGRMAVREMTGLDDTRPAVRQLAQQRLMALNERLVAPIAKAAQDPATAKAACHTLWSMEAFCEGMAASGLLDKPARAKFMQFRNANPLIFSMFFTKEWGNQAYAMQELQSIKDSTGNAEPMVVMALMHPSPEVSRQACALAATGNYRGERVVDLLCQNLQQSGNRYGDQLVAVALGKIGNPRATPYLLEGMKVFGGYYGDVSAFIDAMASTKDLRLVPVLVRRLGRSSGNGSYSSGADGKLSITTSPDDAYFFLLLKLTGQKANTYNMKGVFRDDNPDPSVKETPNKAKVEKDLTEQNPERVGFRDGKARYDAYDKMRKWWNDHKNDPQYRDLEPLPTLRKTEDPNANMHQNSYDECE